MRADGTRFDPPIGDALGVNTLLGGTITAENACASTRASSAGASRCSASSSPISASRSPTPARYSDEVSATIRQDYLPEQYWNGDNTRNTTANTFLTANVTNPFNIANFASLRTTDPVLYNRLASNSFFRSATIQRNRLLRAFPQMTNLSYSNLPLGRVEGALARGAAEPPVLQRAERPGRSPPTG